MVAWFHDTGYTEGTEEHEESSCDIAEKFLSKEGYNKEGIEKIKACIRTTKWNAKPSNLLDEIIRDADSSHFAQSSYIETSELLREELKLLGIKDYSPKNG